MKVITSSLDRYTTSLRTDDFLPVLRERKANNPHGDGNIFCGSYAERRRISNAVLPSRNQEDASVLTGWMIDI